MPTAKTLLIALLLCAASLCALPANAQTAVAAPIAPSDASAQIKANLTEFAGLFNDEKLFSRGQYLVYSARFGFFGASEWGREFYRRYFNIDLIIDDVADYKSANDSATVTVTYHFEPQTGQMSGHTPEFWTRSRQETAQFVPVLKSLATAKPRWQLVAPGSKPNDLEATGFDNSLTNLSFILTQDLNIDNSQSTAERALFNLKMLGLASTMLAIDYDNRYAFAPKYAREALSPYLRKPDPFWVPDTQETYRFNGNLSDIKIYQINEPSRTVLFYDGADEQLNFCYDGKAAVLFADGHSALISPFEAATLRWKP